MTNRFHTQKKKHFSIPYTILLFLVVMVLFLFGINTLTAENKENQKQVLSDTIERDITQCYAIEGFYPPDLTYLKEHYGLTYSESDFIVNYTYIGSNLRPDVTIIERDL